MIETHDRALEYDLMTRTGRTLDEYMSMGAAGMVALVSFVKYLPPDSVLYGELHPKDETGAWFTMAKTNTILADLFDLTVAAHTKKGRHIKPYPRPVKKQTVGRGAIPVSQFWEWWNKGR